MKRKYKRHGNRNYLQYDTIHKADVPCLNVKFETLLTGPPRHKLCNYKSYRGITMLQRHHHHQLLITIDVSTRSTCQRHSIVTLLMDLREIKPSN